MTVRHAFVAAMLAAALVLSASAFASTNTVSATSSVTATYTPSSVPATPTPEQSKKAASSRPTTMTYDLSWTLPSAGKSGCTVCHGDRDLVRVVGGKTVSLYVNTAVLEASAHHGVPCTGCHTDFAYKTPHSNVTTGGAEWRKVAKSSCKNCHQAAFALYSSSAHSPAGQPGVTTSTVGAPDSSAPGMPKPLCGDCHGGHSIPTSNNVEAQKIVHLSGGVMCGKCHPKRTGNYADYYHGSAYKTLAPDAPACWDCHSTHLILPSRDRQSSTNPDRLVDTCKKCHSDPRDGYVSYTELVHGHQKVLDANPLYQIVKQFQATVSSAIDSIKSLFSKGSS